MRVAYICVSPECLLSHRVGALLSYPPLCTPANCLVFFTKAENSIFMLSESLWSSVVQLALSALSLSMTVRGQSILYGLARSCVDTSFPSRRASGCVLWQQVEKVRPLQHTDIDPYTASATQGTMGVQRSIWNNFLPLNFNAGDTHFL